MAGFEARTPCKFHKKGLCCLGAACRFLHTTKVSSPNVLDTSEKTGCSQVSKFGRHPFLHLVVLYASSDLMVVDYAKDVRETLLAAGIDVFLQTTHGIPTKRETKDIKTGNLAEIVSLSPADFLVVVGDKNMKQLTCQAKRKGKLIEMKVEAVVSLIWSSWPQNLTKIIFRIENLNESQTETLLTQYCGFAVSKEFVEFKKSVEAGESRETIQRDASSLVPNLLLSVQVLNQIQVQTEVPKETRGKSRNSDYRPNDTCTPNNCIVNELKYFLLQQLFGMTRHTKELLEPLAIEDPDLTEKFNMLQKLDVVDPTVSALTIRQVFLEEAPTTGSDLTEKQTAEDSETEQSKMLHKLELVDRTVSALTIKQLFSEETPSLSSLFSKVYWKSAAGNPKEPNYSLFQQMVEDLGPKEQETTKNDDLGLTLFPSNIYSDLDFQNPNFLQISKIWEDQNSQNHQ